MPNDLKDLDQLLDDDDEEVGHLTPNHQEQNLGDFDSTKAEKTEVETEDERLKVLRSQMNKVFFKNHEHVDEDLNPQLESVGDKDLDDIFRDLNINDINVDTDNIEDMLSSFINKMLHKDVLYPTLKEMLATQMDSGKPLNEDKEEIVRLICDIYEQDDYSDTNSEQLEKISVLVDKLETMDSDFQDKMSGANGSFDAAELEQLTKSMNPEDCKMQ